MQDKKKRKDEYKNEEIHKLKGNSFQPFKNRQNRVAWEQLRKNKKILALMNFHQTINWFLNNYLGD